MGLYAIYLLLAACGFGLDVSGVLNKLINTLLDKISTFTAVY